MKRVFLTLFAFILSLNFLSAQQTDKETIYFEVDDFELTKNSKAILKNLIKKIEDKKSPYFVINGYTDSDGNNDYNMSLSKARALTVNKYLLTSGIGKTQIKMGNYGEHSPIASNESDEGKAKNRRVEITILKNAISKPDFFSKWDKETQYFKVSSVQDIVIKGKEGTTVIIPKNALIKKNGEQIAGEVEIELKEFYKKSDMLLSNLNTMSGKEILETAGMIYIAARYSGEDLKIKEGQEIELEMASKNKIDGMQTFNGQFHDNQINWTQSNFMTSTEIIAFNEIGYEAYERDTIAMKELIKIDKMIIKSGNLGWINCDRFTKFQNRTQLLVEIDTIYKPVVRLVFKDISSILPGYYTKEKKIIVSNIPVGQKATIVAFGLVNDTPYFASKDITISPDLKENLKLIKTMTDAIEQELKKLN